MLERYHILPSQYLGIPPEEVDHEAERAFLLACLEKASIEQKAAMKEAARKK